eukprot:jgi/Astpho2/2296/fgenesh1_pg.00040_%23_104_t
MSETEVENSVKNWTGPKEAEYAALLNDLAQLKLSTGQTTEAQQLFRQAIEVSQESKQQRPDAGVEAGPSAEQEAANEEEEEGSWETDWEAGVAALQAKREPVAPKAKPKAKPRDQTASQKRQSQQSHSPGPSPGPAGQPQDSDGGPLDREDGAEPPVPIPFGGDHILECCEVSRRDALNELEGWCRSQQGSGLAAVVREVDSSHALVVCSNPAEAVVLLKASLESKWMLQPFEMASAQSKKQKPGQYLPPKLRGETTTAVARRLIGAGLNMKGFSDKTADEKLRQQRKDAKVARQHKKEQLDAAWGDD